MSVALIMCVWCCVLLLDHYLVVFKGDNIKKIVGEDEIKTVRNLRKEHLVMHSELMPIIINNYSPKWRRLVVDIYRAAKRRGKYPLLTTHTEVNSCFSIY